MKILSDAMVSGLLKTMSSQDVQDYQNTLLRALLEYQNDHSLIPQRIVTTTPFCTHLFMASTGSIVGMKAITGSPAGFKGITTILDKHEGFPIGIINGKTLTAFRTALCTSLSLIKTFPINSTEIKPSGDLICFGVGDQALWHIKLSLILYPGAFNKVFIINRSIEKADAFVDELKPEFPGQKFVTVSGTDSDAVAASFKEACVIYSCVPTTEPTILNSYLDGNVAEKIFIGTIGSYKPHMIEIEGELIKAQCLNKGGKVIVDSMEHCLEEAGEFLQNNIHGDSLIEVAQLFEGSSEETVKSQLEFIKTNKVVISKIVGLCIMDVHVGNHVLGAAESKGIGLDMETF
ncbi:hypothetical protein CANARDRAFT_9294 [[Candida] arabinofermentans NRRL YB-2248]|uniref:Ornithine cyclodeaminase n=1 Tax=[Candida] arabinofermentans NRRL YB-2248 TaxID=983967 RepID=A0A1E4SW55_9ASCO|nr:hypothetical protein CANARDRAFT_9294 [[Candida] arabinofermentans NRRL YB-2248]